MDTSASTPDPNDAALDPLSRAIRQADRNKKIGGLTRIATVCDVSYQAVRRWRRDGRLPRTELIDPSLGGTDYAARIASLPEVSVKAEELLEWSRQAWSRS